MDMIFDLIFVKFSKLDLIILTITGIDRERWIT